MNKHFPEKRGETNYPQVELELLEVVKDETSVIVVIVVVVVLIIIVWVGIFVSVS